MSETKTESVVDTVLELSRSIMAVVRVIRAEPLGVPESGLYIAVGCDKAKYDRIALLLEATGLVKRRGNLWTAVPGKDGADG